MELKRGEVVFSCLRFIEKDKTTPHAFPKDNILWKVDMVHRASGKKVTVVHFNKKRAIKQAFDLLDMLVYPKEAGD